MITTIVTKYLTTDFSLVLEAKESPDKQFISPFKTLSGVEYKLEFAQVIVDTLYVIYKPV
jgi:hypothetical protein